MLLFHYSHCIVRIDRFSQFVSTVSHFPQIWIININLHTGVVVILKIGGHYSSPGWWPVTTGSHHGPIIARPGDWQPIRAGSGPELSEVTDFALIRSSRIPMGAGCGYGGSELLTNVLTLYPRLTIAYYPHCQAKYCPSVPVRFYSHNKASNSPDISVLGCSS